MLFRSVVSQRLQLKNPDHFPDDPYDLGDVHEAAQYALHGTPAAPPPSTATAIPTTTVVPSASTEMKTEDIAAIVERITNSFVKALTAVNARTE